jgi:pimeloyl-ACP methyl ester carboxylesterase
VNDQPSPLSAAGRERAVEIDGARGHVIEIGDRGPTLVLLPSMLVLGRSYTWLRRVLCRDFRVLIIEMPGCGQGSVLSEAWSFEHYARWLTRLLEQTPLSDRPTVIGHSNSGPVALILAATRPDLVGRLVLVDSVGADSSKSLLRVLGGRAFDAVLEARLTFWGFHHILYNLFRHWRNFWNQVWLAVRHDATGHAPRTTTPTLVAWGRRDHTMPLRGAHVLEQAISDAKLHVSPTGSHDWLITNPVEFTETLRAFVIEGSTRSA